MVIRAAFTLLFLFAVLDLAVSQEPSPSPSYSPDQIRSAFQAVHDGWSVDEVLLHDDRRNAFLKQVGGDEVVAEKAILESLLKLRKSGKLDVPTTRRESSDLEEVLPAAEIAARHIQDQWNATTDEILFDPKVRNLFDQVATSVDPNATTYELRKAAIKLRKSRLLKPELTLRVADWKREIKVLSLEDAKRQVASFPKANAVYLFRDKSGYLYIGQTNNLKERMTKHLSDSDRRSLARYLKERTEEDIQVELHIFASDSPAKDTSVREAYESELIRSRKPRFNVAP